MKFNDWIFDSETWDNPSYILCKTKTGIMHKVDYLMVDAYIVQNSPPTPVPFFELFFRQIRIFISFIQS